MSRLASCATFLLNAQDVAKFARIEDVKGKRAANHSGDTKGKDGTRGCTYFETQN